MNRWASYARKHLDDYCEIHEKYRIRGVPPPIIFDDDDDAPIDSIALFEQPDNPTPEDILIAKENTAEIGRAMQRRLSPREEYVVRSWFGFGEDEPNTLDQVGSAFGVTRERARQIANKACRKLRKQLKSQKDRYRWRFAVERDRQCREEMLVHDAEWDLIIARNEILLPWSAPFLYEIKPPKPPPEVAAARQRIKHSFDNGFQLREDEVTHYARVLHEMLSKARGYL